MAPDEIAEASTDPMYALIEQALRALFKAVVEVGGEAFTGASNIYELGLELGEVPEGYEGDIAVAMFPLARTLKRPPLPIAREVAERFNNLMMDGFRALAVGPYVNITLPFNKLREGVFTVINGRGEDYGRYPPNGIRAIVEHTSANPTGPLHVGRARNPIIGDTLARMMRFLGYDVTTEYYVNDMGKQTATLYWGMENLGEGQGMKETGSVNDRPAYRVVAAYQRASAMAKEDHRVEEAIGEIIRRYEGGDEHLKEAIRALATSVLKDNENTLARIGITFDSYVLESDFVFNGMTQDIISNLRAKDMLKERDGAYYVDLSDYDIPAKEKIVYVSRSDGSTLYITRDLAYHMDKLNRAERVIDILGEDHKMQSRILKILLKMLGVEREYDVLFHSFVSLPEGKMSTRAGRVVYLDTLLEEGYQRALEEVRKRRADLDEGRLEEIARVVGANAVRFNMIRIYHEKNIVFRWEDALNFDGDSAPFVMYTYARASGILNKAGMEREEYWDMGSISNLQHPSEIALIKAIAAFPSTLKEAVRELRPSSMAQFAVTLANCFNQFYRDCSVLGAEGSMKKARLMLVEAYRITMGNVMYVLGLRPLSEM